MTDRIGSATRTTSESDITVEINLDGSGRVDVDTGLLKHLFDLLRIGVQLTHSHDPKPTTLPPLPIKL